MHFDDMNELQRRLHNAAIVAECDGDEYGHAGVMRDAIDEINRLANKLASLYCVNGALRTGDERYETARRMNPRQWADAWKLNTTTGKPFDEIIDDMRPCMVPNAI